MIVRARNLRAAANFIPSKAFRARKIYFCNEVCLIISVYSCFSRRFYGLSVLFLIGRILKFHYTVCLCSSLVSLANLLVDKRISNLMFFNPL